MQKKVQAAFSAIASLLLLAGCAEPYRIKRNLTYGEGRFDLYLPNAGQAPYPTVIAIHGGAWTGGDKTWGKQVADMICWRGYAVAAPSYRLAPEHVWPAQLDDTVAATTYLARHGAPLGVDPSRLALLGHSAGGQLAVMTSWHVDLSDSMRYRIPAVSLAGEGDLTRLGLEPVMANEDWILSNLLGRAPTAQDLRDLSPAYHVDSQSRLLLIHSYDDTNVYPTQAAALHSAAQAVGADSTLVMLNAGHNVHRTAEARGALLAWLATAWEDH